jgi:hypothetical protein
MWFSPELQRNFWLQLSWSRVIAAPVLLGVILAAVVAAIKPEPIAMAEYARWAYVALLAFWSTRRVADSVAEEISGATWEGQRMSGLSAWSMMWGKLLGGTVFPWYCALICLGVMVWYGLQVSPDRIRVPLIQQVGTLLLAGLLGQATSLTVALALLRKSRTRRRIGVTIAQIAGLLTFGVATGWDYVANPWAANVGTIAWFGRTYDAWQFYLGSAAVFTAWVLLAVWRLMRMELLYVNRPWVWALFIIFAMVYVAGFYNINFEVQTVQLLVATQTGVMLTYLAFLTEPKDPVRYRWGIARFAALQWWRTLEFVPLWLVTYVITAAIGLVTIWAVTVGGVLGPQTWAESFGRWVLWFMVGGTGYQIGALLLFTLRDMLFLLWLNFGPFRGRADLAGIVTLAIAYVPLPMVLTGAGLLKFLPAASPIAATQLTDLVWPVAEVIVVAILLFARWRSASRIEIADDRDEPQMH